MIRFHRFLSAFTRAIAQADMRGLVGHEPDKIPSPLDSGIKGPFADGRYWLSKREKL